MTLQLLRNISLMVELPIFLALDGPREPNDEFQQDQLISAIRSSGLQVSVVIGKENRGCARGVVNSIDALFRISNSTIGIVLEDDCWPTISFFDFVQENASKLVRDWLTITGQSVGSNPDGSLTFSSYPLIHGWAISRKNWDEVLQNVMNSKHARFQKDIPWKMKKFFERTISKVDTGYLDTWDSHFTYASWRLSQLSACKMNATVLNVGEMSSRDPKAVKHINQLKPASSSIFQNYQMDIYLERLFFGVTYSRALLWAFLNQFNAFLRFFKQRKLTLGQRIRLDLESPTDERYYRVDLSNG